MSTPHEKLVEDIASARGMESLIIGPIVRNDKYSVAMLPVLLALLGDLCLFGQDPLERLGIPFIKIYLLLVRYLEHIALVVPDGPQQESKKMLGLMIMIRAKQPL